MFPRLVTAGYETTLSVPPWWLAGDGRTVVQMSRPAYASVVGSLVSSTPRFEPVVGSMRETVPLLLFATQTAPFPYAIPVGASPTLIFVTFGLPGSTRVTVSSGVFATHTAPEPTATPVGPFPIGVRCTT